MKLMAVQSHFSANERVKRHWPFYERAGADKIIGIGREDTEVWFPGGITVFNIGKDSYVDGDNLCKRLVQTFERMLEFEQYDNLIVIEQDTIFYRRIPEITGYASHHAGGKMGGFNANVFWHNPWCTDRTSAEAFVREGNKMILEGDIENGEPDHFWGRAIERMNAKCEHIKGYTQNTISTDQEAVYAAKVCLDHGGVFVHGVDHEETLNIIGTMWGVCMDSERTIDE